DGSYLMMNSEIVTAVVEGLSFTIVLVDNHGYQSIHGLQRSLGVPSFANELRRRDPVSGRLDGAVVELDYVAHAASLGAKARAVHDQRELSEALAAAKVGGGVQVIVVSVNPEQRVPSFGSWWDVPVAEVSQRRSVVEARGAYETEAARAQEYRLRQTRTGAGPNPAGSDASGPGEDR